MAFLLVILYSWFKEAITNSMGEIPSGEANSLLAGQEIPHFLWNPQVHYHVHKT
jgi:hypothetical protein